MDDVLERAAGYGPSYGDRGDMIDLIADLAAEVRELRADLIWAVDHGASGGYDGSSWPCIWYSVQRTDKYDHDRALTSIETDGTYESWPRAIRKARLSSRGEDAGA